MLTLAEWARDSWPFGGVPPGGIALGQAGGPLLGTARLGGNILVAALTYLAGVALGNLVVALYRRRGVPRSPDLLASCLGIVLVLALGLWGALAPDGGPPTRTDRVAIVQGGGRRGLSDLEVPASVVYAATLRATMRVRPPVALVLWPEDIVALTGPLAGSPEAMQLSGLAKRLHTTLLAGVTETVGSGPVPQRDRRLLGPRALSSPCSRRCTACPSASTCRGGASSPTWRTCKRCPATP